METRKMVTQLMEQSEYDNFSYDTTYQIGDFYVSLLVVRVSYFEEEPILSVAFMIHDRRFYEVHNLFFTSVKAAIKKLDSQNCIFIIDREKAILRAITTVLSKKHIVHCWNYIKSDVDHQVYKLKENKGMNHIYRGQMSERPNFHY